MRPWRSWWANLIVVAVLLLGGLPTWLALVVVIGVVKLDKWYYFLRETRAAEESVDDPDLTAQVGEICREAGLDDLRIVAVRGNGGPYLNVRGNQLFVSRKAAEDLTEAEMAAAVLHRAVTPPSQVWRIELEPLWPWGAVTFLVTLIGLRPSVWVTAAFMLCLMAWAWSYGQSRPYCPWLTREHFQTFLDRGGDGPNLIAALAKTNWHIAGDLPQGSIQNRFAARAWANLRLMADMCGMSDGKLEALANQHGVADLYGSAGMSVWHRMGFTRTIFMYAAAVLLVQGYLAWALRGALAHWISRM